MNNFKDHPTKKIIREKWCKPLLAYLNSSLGYKLNYMGLPGIDALDIICWIDYLNNIIAFDCGDYSQSPNPEVVRKNLDKLNNILSKLERQGSIKNYSLYNGFVEKVVLKQFDEGGVKFDQNEIVNIYNLDFCNSLTVPLVITNPQGGISKHYKTEVIRKLLEIQRDLGYKNEGNKKRFVMFLTVNSKFWDEEAKKLVKRLDSETFKNYMRSVSKLKGFHKNIRLLKLYAFYVLKDHFCNCQFIPDFLPPIYYKSGSNTLICFTLFGVYYKHPSASAPFNQEMKNLLMNKFLFADEQKIFAINYHSFKEQDIDCDPVKLFTQTATYKRFWKDNK